MILTFFPGGGGGISVIKPPEVTVQDYVWDGTEQGPIIQNLDTKHVIVKGDKAMAAGTYTLTLSLKNPKHQIWADVPAGDPSANADKTLTYVIKKKRISIPAPTIDTYTYTGEAQGPTDYEVDPVFVSSSGEQGTDAGDYNLSFDLKDKTNTCWSDGTDEEKAFPYTIGKADGTLVLSSDSVLVDKKTSSTTVSVSGYQGAISVSSSDESIVTAAIADDTITIASPSKKSGTASITVTSAETDNYKSISKTISVRAKYAIIYGVTWDKTSSTRLTRTNASASFEDPAPAVSGGTGSSPFDTCMPWSGIERATINDQELVKIPKYWIKVTNTDTEFTVLIADDEEEGFHVSPAHMDRGDGFGERDFIYVGRYTSGSNFDSKTGQYPRLNTSRPTFRTNFKKIGAGFYEWDYLTWLTIIYLYLVEFADWNVDKTIGSGYTRSGSSGGSPRNSGMTDNMKYHTGTMSGTKMGNGCVQYRYMENLWGNVYEWVDGINFNSEKTYVLKNPELYKDDTAENGTELSSQKWKTQTNTYITDWVSDETNPEYIVPGKAGGTSTTFIPDWQTFRTGWAILAVGGNWWNVDISGLFMFYADQISSAEIMSIGSRLMYLPQGEETAA